MKKTLIAAVWSLVYLLLAGAVGAQNTSVSCLALLRVALENARVNCAGLQANQVCYGNAPVSAQPQAGVADFQLSDPGDIEDVSRVQSLQVTTLDFTRSEYGVARMNLSPRAGSGATLLLLGNVEITNRVETLPTMSMTVNQPINVRVGPGSNEGLAGSLAAGTVVTATGRAAAADGQDWIRINFPEHASGMGWIVGWALDSDTDRSQLAQVHPTDTILNPMEAFVVRTGANDAPCQPATDSGLLMQTLPDQTATLTINGAVVELNGTGFLQTVDNVLYLSNLAGGLNVSFDSVKRVVPTGALTWVSLGTDLLAIDRPVFPESYDLSVLERLPLAELPLPVTLVRALTMPEIVELLSEKGPQSGTWAVSGEPAACFPSTSHPAVFSSDWLLGTGTLTFAEDGSSFTFTGGPGGFSTHTLIAPDTFYFVDQNAQGKTEFITRVVDAETLVTEVNYAYVTGAGNCTSSASWTWKPVGG